LGFEGNLTPLVQVRFPGPKGNPTPSAPYFSKSLI